MAQTYESESRTLLTALQSTMAEALTGQTRLNKIVTLIARSMQCQVCSVYLFVDDNTLELCATQGLNSAAVHKTRMRIGEGLVGRVARTGKVINTANAPQERGFKYMSETGEEIYASFAGVPIMRLGEKIGVVVLQSKEARRFSEDAVYAIEVVAMVLAEMKELGAFVDEQNALHAPHQKPITQNCAIAQEGLAQGRVFLHEPRVTITKMSSDNPAQENARLKDALEKLRVSIDDLLLDTHSKNTEQRQILEAFRLFAHSEGWPQRIRKSIIQGLSAEAAVEKEQTVTRNRMQNVTDAYLRDRLNDIDDLLNKLLRILTGQGENTGAQMPDNPVLVARNIGPAELLRYGDKLKGIVLEEGAVGSHAAIIARALSIPMVIHATNMTIEALNGDPIMIDGQSGQVHLRPSSALSTAFGERIKAQKRDFSRYEKLRDMPAKSLCGRTITLNMNAGVMAHLPSLAGSGAAGVGLFRTELQFLTYQKLPQRDELQAHYETVFDAAQGKPVVFRTLDIGSDKVLPFMQAPDEPNPAMGLRGIRLGIEMRVLLKMQMQSMLRAAKGRPLHIMFPFVTSINEYENARELLEQMLAIEARAGRPLPKALYIGAMLETPALAFTPQERLKQLDFLCIGGNDLKQFFFAADRENEQVRSRYDTLSSNFLTFLENIVKRCQEAKIPLSFCGEDAGRPTEALCLAALGLDSLSMRAISIGRAKEAIRRTNLQDLKGIIDTARNDGKETVRDDVTAFLSKSG